MILFSQQKRRSNRQVKRKKYTEDLDIKITDDEDEMDADVDVTTTPVSAPGHVQSMGVELQQELDGDGLPSMQFFVVRQHTIHCHLFPFHNWFCQNFSAVTVWHIATSHKKRMIICSFGRTILFIFMCVGMFLICVSGESK